jgi:hypothetical protein
VILLIATGSLIERSEYFDSAYTWLQPWEFIPSIAGFVGLTLPLCCGYSPLHLFSSDNSCYPAPFPGSLNYELPVPQRAGRTNRSPDWAVCVFHLSIYRASAWEFVPSLPALLASHNPYATVILRSTWLVRTTPVARQRFLA